MSQSKLAGYQTTGTTDAPTLEDSDRSRRTILVDAATTNLSLQSWETFNVVSDLTEDTLDRLA